MLRLIALVSFSVIASGALAQNIATVNNRPIPKAREDAWVKTLTQQGQQDSPQLREMVKQELIRREIFMQEATRRGLPEKADVKFQLDVQRQNALIQALMRDEMDKRPITDADVQKAYDEQKAKAGSKEFRARHILVDKEEEAKAIIDQLKKGAKFEELAKKSKDTGSAANGGDLDWASPDGFVKPFSDAMTKLEKGKITEAPVQTQFGCTSSVLMTCAMHSSRRWRRSRVRSARRCSSSAFRPSQRSFRRRRRSSNCRQSL
jgi:peptidyl-prolyl cis-trans isomerase C